MDVITVQLTVNDLNSLEAFELMKDLLEFIVEKGDEELLSKVTAVISPYSSKPEKVEVSI